LIAKVEQAAHAAGFVKVRVLTKVNAQGELVIALLIPPRYEHNWDSSHETKH
jgi:hypothetical protein